MECSQDGQKERSSQEASQRYKMYDKPDKENIFSILAKKKKTIFFIIPGIFGLSESG
jgi:hypothetical protein